MYIEWVYYILGVMCGDEEVYKEEESRGADHKKGVSIQIGQTTDCERSGLSTRIRRGRRLFKLGAASNVED